MVLLTIGNAFYFRIHFILLDKYLSQPTLNIYSIINGAHLLRNIRNLETATFNCDQYGDTLGNIINDKSLYLANFLCKIEININDISSIKFENIEIDNVYLIDDLNKEFKIEEINKYKTPMEDEYEGKNMNRITVKKVTDAKLKNELTFKIELDIDFPTLDERNYDIKLNNEDGVQIVATCTIPILNVLEDKNINCNAPKDNIKEKLTFMARYVCL